jgi:hypothetical protein
VEVDMRIEYLYTEGKRAEDCCPITVRLDGRVSGYIVKDGGGYRYKHKGETSRNLGDVFDTIQKVQDSLG